MTVRQKDLPTYLSILPSLLIYVSSASSLYTLYHAFKCSMFIEESIIFSSPRSHQRLSFFLSTFFVYLCEIKIHAHRIDRRASPPQHLYKVKLQDISYEYKSVLLSACHRQQFGKHCASHGVRTLHEVDTARFFSSWLLFQSIRKIFSNYSNSGKTTRANHSSMYHFDNYD